MQIRTSFIRNGRQNLTTQQLSRKNVRERQDVQQEIRRLLIKHGFTMEAIVIKYKDIVYSSNNYEPKGSDFVRILEKLLNMHGVQNK